MRITSPSRLAAAVLATVCALASVASAATSADEETAAPARAMIEKYCLSCHQGEKPDGGLDLIKLMAKGPPAGHRKPWRRVKENVEGGMMPPEDQPQPTEEEAESLAAWIGEEMKKDDCDGPVNPGKVTIRRLNRAEYDNTIRDLTGVDFHPADDFPSDDVGYGFDNIGDVLSLPPILMEKYMAAARAVAARAIDAGGDGEPPATIHEGDALESAGGSPYREDGRILASNGEIAVDHDFPRGSEYVVRVVAFGQQAGDQPARMELRVDGRPLRAFDVAAEAGSPGTFEHRFKVPIGSHRIAAAFVNDFYDPDHPDRRRRDRNLVVLSILVRGPFRGPDDEPPPGHDLILVKRPNSPEEFTDSATVVLERFLRRAYRRPVTGGEVSKLVRLAELARENGESFERGIQLAVRAVLASPQFLYKVELFRPVRDKKGKIVDQPDGVPLNADEVAVRLSYFLWSSMPDEELFRLADEKKLLDPAVLEAQVRRMLRDPKSDALVTNFAGQWLQLRGLEVSAPDKELFRAFDEPLRQAMRRESELFFAAILREDRSIVDFLDADYTFLNERLARHYGISGVTGDDFREVKLSSRERGGLITQASILTSTSNPSRTSIVKRGKWVLEQILGDPPPPQPADVPALADDSGEPIVGTLRERVELHRSRPNCIFCHLRLDPPGFGLENYDAIGAWREKDGDQPIDASSEMTNGDKFDGPVGLKDLLKGRKDQFARALTEKLLTYALGRGLEEFDDCTVERITKAASEDGDRLSRIVLEIVKSTPFLRRKG
jgi:mono/diheme cytochrome c family protein